MDNKAGSGSKLRQRRKSRGLTLEQVAAVTGIDRSEIGRYEHGKVRGFTAAREERLAAFYGVTVATLRREAGFRVKVTKRETLVPVGEGAA